MAKRITRIKVNNFRAYYGSYEGVKLPNGENLLIYGENGSGKSSLYKALNNYLASSIKPALNYVKNRYQNGDDGEIDITFSDIDNTTSDIILGTEVNYKFGSAGSTNQVPFIQTAALVKGFLDYTDLLKVYLHSEPTPNLFDLIVLSLLGDHIPVSSGGNFRFQAKWQQLQSDLIEHAYTRNDNCHKNAKRELPIYETHLRHTLNQVFNELNRLLTVYFPDLAITLNYDLRPFNFNYVGWKSDWYTTADLRLNVIKDNILITGDYSDLLNEARLSAIAICLYLASLLVNPTSVDLKILYLDDVFIGLDASNRLPILSILKNEFTGYQKFISTYDRHWYELSKRHFEIQGDLSWSAVEIYVGMDEVGGTEITKPIIIKGLSSYEKAIQYLHNRSRPDYPAAANYFRKSLEKMITDYIPKFELVGSDYAQIQEYKLTKLLAVAQRFLEKTGNNLVDILKITGLLHNLLHPLSHHEITSPIYKGELIILENAIAEFKNQLDLLNIPISYKIGIEKGKRIKITYIIDVATGHERFYEIFLKDSLIIQKDAANVITLAKANCYLITCYGTKNGTTLKPYNPRKTDVRFNYQSIEIACDNIYNFIVAEIGVVFPKPIDYTTIIEYFNGTVWKSFASKLVW